MGRYTVIPENAFDGLQVDAGVLLKRFNIEQAAAGEVGFTDADIICATSGGVNPTCVPTYSDYAEDVDNAPTNLKEFKHLDGWECKLATTSLGNSPELIKLSLGAADIDLTNTGKIVPRKSLQQSDFTDIWWVGDRADGGFVAIQILNALSTGGFSLQTTKNGKGTVSLEITGHVSINAQNVVPMVFYSIDPVSGGVHVTGVGVVPSALELEVDDTERLTAVITPSNADDKVVAWASSDTAVATVDSEGIVTAKAAGTATITVTTHDGSYTDTCSVTVAS